MQSVALDNFVMFRGALYRKVEQPGQLERTALQYKRFIPPDVKARQREQELKLQEDYLRRKQRGLVSAPPPKPTAPVGPSSLAPEKSGRAVLVVKVDNAVQEEVLHKVVKAITLTGGRIDSYSCKAGEVESTCTFVYSATKANVATVKHFLDRLFTDVLHLPAGTWLFDHV